MNNKTEQLANNKDKTVGASTQTGNSRGKRFVKDFGIYALGNLATKLITFFLVPLYTYYVNDPGDYGYFDMCLATCFLLMPIMTLQMRDGSYRLLINSTDEEYRTKVVSFVYRTFFMSVLFCVAVAALVAVFMPVRCLWYTLALLVTMSLFEIAMQMIRATSDNITYSVTVVTSVFFTALFAVLFVVILDMGIDGIFLSNILSKIVGLIIAEYRVGLFRRYLRVNNVQIVSVGKELLKFSLPLIPTAVCWWLIGSSNRYFIKYFLGLEINGYYAVAARMNTILYTMGVIFYQTWQENAFRQFDSPDRDKFFSEIFNNFIFVVLTMFIIYVFGIKLVFPWLIGPSYQQSVMLVYPLALVTIFSTTSSFFDIAYQCAKETARSVPAIIVTAIVVLALNFILVKPFGVYGIISSALLSYIVYSIYRFYDTRRYFILTPTWKLVLPFAVVAFSSLPFYLNTNPLIDMIWAAIALCGCLFAMPVNTRLQLIGMMKRKFTKKETVANE